MHMRSCFLKLLLCAALLFIPQGALGQGGSPEGFHQTIVEATCTEPGYIIMTDPESGASSVQSLPALGHDFSEWIADESTGKQNRTCSVCGLQEQIRISTVDESRMPRLDLTGSLEGIGKKTKVVLEATFVGMGEQAQCYAIMTLQGHSTFGYPKHNYTIRFYEDDQSVRKHKLKLKEWKKEHKFILKANYVDLSQCRNLVCCRIWRSMVACREHVSPRIAALPTLGTVDGFPVDVYLNGEYFGLYTMNLHKDDDLYQMKDGEQAALVICNRQTTDESLFRGRALFASDYSSDWEIEFCGTDDTAWARDSFNDLIDFIMQSSDTEFREQLAAHLDVDAAIDYLLFSYALGLPYSSAKDMVMLNYGDVWIPSAYDMDGAFGLDAEAGAYISPEEFVPRKEDGIWQSGTGSLLWDRLLNSFSEQLCARYTFLRGGVLSETSILRMIEAFTEGIPQSSFDLDRNLYPDRPIDDPDMIKQMTDYITRRLDILDLALEVHEQ